MSVDREELAAAILSHQNLAVASGGEVSPLELADSLLASGLFRDVRDVQAEALEQAADDLTPGDDKVDDWGIQAGLLRARAQAIREARSER